MPEPELPPGTKVTTGTQSDYRESEAQTVPFTPDYIIPEPNEKQRALNQQHHLIDGIPEVRPMIIAVLRCSVLLWRTSRVL